MRRIATAMLPLPANAKTHPVIARLDGYIVISLRGTSGFVRE